MRSVPELPLPVVVQHERLYPLEGSEDGLRTAGTEGSQDDTAGGWYLPLLEDSLVLLERAEHESCGGALLQERREDPAVQTDDPLRLQLGGRVPGRDPVELLAEHGLVDGEGDGDVDDATAPPGGVLSPLSGGTWSGNMSPSLTLSQLQPTSGIFLVRGSPLTGVGRHQVFFDHHCIVQLQQTIPQCLVSSENCRLVLPGSSARICF